MATTIFRFLSVFLAAILAGTSFGIWVGFNPVEFSADTYVELQKHTVKSLHTLMVSLVVSATIITIISAFLQKKNQRIFITLLLASLFFIACILISRFGNKPIQDEMLNWNADALPADWESLRDRWWMFHIVRTIAELIALVLIILVNIKGGKSLASRDALSI